MTAKRGNRSAGESSIGGLIALVAIGILSRTPYALDAVTATALTALCTAISSKVFGDRAK